jgi:hypothetical protein
MKRKAAKRAHAAKKRKDLSATELKKLSGGVYVRPGQADVYVGDYDAGELTQLTSKPKRQS